MVGKVAPTEATVLINGENGTGKELVASELYRRSGRRNAPFIKVNCAAISETLIESEFFGHEKGAFTGAMQRREGRFELADGGTILLDEISEISPKVQAKLLRVLQEREFERVGGNKTIKVDVRVVATTNRDLMKSVERGDFRQDLYYRLNVFPIHVPPLRERQGDVLLLAKTFAQKFARKHGINLRGFEDAASRSLSSHPWPGNVRELQNTIERAVILSESGSKISADSLGLMPMMANVSAPAFRETVANPEPVGAGAGSAGYGGSNQIEFPPSTPVSSSNFPAQPGGPDFGDEPLPLDQIEKQHILSTLETTEGNRTHAAKILGISIRTLRNKLAIYREDGEFIAGEE
jgi:transcriptional regulator with GAF, ATPase, and Fis domain